MQIPGNSGWLITIYNLQNQTRNKLFSGSVLSTNLTTQVIWTATNATVAADFWKKWSANLSCCVAKLKSNWFVVDANNDYHTYTGVLSNMTLANRSRRFRKA